MLKIVLTINIYAKYPLMFPVKSQYPVSVKPELDHLFENPVPVKPEREWGNIYYKMHNMLQGVGWLWGGGGGWCRGGVCGWYRLVLGWFWGGFGVVLGVLLGTGPQTK